MMTRNLLWFSNNLRLKDNELLAKASSNAQHLLPVYIFDPRQWRKVSPGFLKTGKFRTNFLIETVTSLKQQLQDKGSDLWIGVGKPEELIPDLVSSLDITAVFYQEEFTPEEMAVQNGLENALWKIGIPCKTVADRTLLDPKDLPFSIPGTPEIFTDFRKKVERELRIQTPVSAPLSLPPVPEKIHFNEVADLGKVHPILTSTAPTIFKGGEDAAWDRLNDYFWTKDLLQSYKETRNGLLGMDYSSKFSPWLSLGSITARQIFFELKRYETERLANDSTYWLFFELLWRDYFHFMARKHGTNIFLKKGYNHNQTHVQNSRNPAIMNLWMDGKTGNDFVDATMNELHTTGYMSNRARQNAASFLIHDLQLDWTWGARYFESMLVDYDVHSNWGNWAYLAGVGSDPRGHRKFNTEFQANAYDPTGEYRKYWL